MDAPLSQLVLSRVHNHSWGNSLSSLQGLSNWGRGPLRHDLDPDENSVVVIAFFQVCGGLAADVESVSVHYELKAKSDQAGGGIPFSTADNYTQGLFNVIKLDTSSFHQVKGFQDDDNCFH